MTPAVHYPATLEQIALGGAFHHLDNFCRHVDSRYQVAPHHARLIEALTRVEQGMCRRLIVNMPPRHGKSLTTTTYFPGWFLGKHPEDEVIIASYSADLAQDFSRACRNTFQEHGPSIFGVRVADDSRAVDQWRLAHHHGGLNAAGVDGSLTGKGAKVLIIDDPHKNQTEAYSDAFRKRVKDFYTSAARTRLAPRGTIVVIQTRWHEDDLTGWLLEESEQGGEQFEVINLPFVREDGELLKLALHAKELTAEELDRDIRADLLWPEQFGDDYGTPRQLAAFIRAIGATVFYALYQGRPTPAEGNMIKADWLKRRWRAPDLVNPVDVEGQEVITLTKRQLEGYDWDQLVLAVDCTFKNLADNDRVAAVLVGLKYPKKFVLDVRWDRMSFGETVAAIRDIRAKWNRRINVILVEDKANGSAVIETLQGKIPGVIPVSPGRDNKESRTQGTVIEWESGNVWLPEDAPWVQDAIYELTKFPRVRHDDFVDAVTYALLRLSDSSSLAYARAMTEA